MGPFLMWKSGGPSSTYIYHDSDKGNVKLISGSPADGEAVEGTGYGSTCVPALKFITPLCDTGCMMFCDEDDVRSETPGDCAPVSSLTLRKACMWEEY